MWDLPGLGIEPMSPALAGGFLTTAPPGSPINSYLDLYMFSVLKDSLTMSPSLVDNYCLSPLKTPFLWLPLFIVEKSADVFSL